MNEFVDTNVVNFSHLINGNFSEKIKHSIRV